MNVAITRYDGRNFSKCPIRRILVMLPASSEGRFGEKDRCHNGQKSICKRSVDLQALQIGSLKNALRLARSGSGCPTPPAPMAPEENELVVESVA